MITVLEKIGQALYSPSVWAISFLSAYFAPLLPLAIAVFLVVAVDFITGIIRARKTKEKIESIKMRRTITKLLAYLSVLMLVFVFETTILTFKIGAINFVAAIIFLVEAQSVSENCEAITEKKIFGEIYKKVVDLFKTKNK